MNANEIMTRLKKMFRTEERLLKWMETPNHAFGGQRPCDMILKENGRKQLAFMFYDISTSDPD